MRRFTFLTGIGLLACGSLSAASLFGVCGTGFTNDTCSTEATSGFSDGNWTLSTTAETISGSAPFVTLAGPFTGTPHWVADSGSSKWISPRILETGSSDAAGVYTYTETFTIAAPFLPSSAVIAGKWTADNSGFIELNGTEVDPGAAIATGTAGAFQNFVNFTINSGFVLGTNTLTFVVTNSSTGSPNVTGLDVQITEAQIFTPEPATFGFMGAGLAALAILGRKLRA